MPKAFDLISWLFAGTLFALLIAPVERVSSTAVALTVTAGVFGFMRWLDRRDLDDKARIKEELHMIRSEIDAIKAGKVFGR